MGLQPEQAVDHLHAALLQHPRPLDVARLVEARLQFDDRRHLLAVLRGARERLQDRRVTARPVQRLLDRQYVGVVGRARHQLHHGVERVVRVVEEHVLLADHREDVVGVPERGRHLGGERLVAQLTAFVVRDHGHQVGEVERAVDAVHVGALVDLQRPAEAGDAGLHALAHADLDAYGVAAVAAPELCLDGGEQVLPLLLVDLQVPVPRDAERVGAPDLRRREELLHVPGDHVLQQHEGAPLTLDRHPDQPAQHRRHLDHREARLLPLVLPREHDPEVDHLVPQVRERVPRVHREGRQHREDVGPEALVERGLRRGLQVLGLHQHDPRLLQRREEVLVPQAVRRVEEGVGPGADRRELLVRGEAVGGDLGDRSQRLRLEARHAHHEELVDVREEDPEELQPFEEGGVRAGLGEHPAVELEPGQLAVQVMRRVVLDGYQGMGRASDIVRGGDQGGLGGGRCRIGHRQRSTLAQVW
ncbi:Hypothetical protein CAP_8433 [Chondromyces apiculatus DSM 436]|uniref:Uncharacterized protein n=1 Tax=Chondromyces apiculatus DSM 436 TaxID=1192034 RepID=A0A017SWC5_9BACT|nr:Hypothetical protein CAP_8433 [Chondromyces apiculatus DSM 436]